MAIVTSFETVEGNGKIHPTEVVGFVTIFSEANGEKVVQINTTGSRVRAVPGTTSQTLQLKEEAARQLHDILKHTYLFD